MAHALEHMMFRGSPGLSAEQLANITALMGGQFNADTQQTVTQYFFTVPGDDLDVALHVEAERMKGILATQELWEKERGAIEQEVAQDLSNPEYLLSMQLLAELFKGTPYAHDALGTRPSFQQTSAAMLRQFYDAWYAPNNATLVIAGDVDPERTLVKVKELFESIPARPVPARAEINLQPLEPAALSLDTDRPYGLSVVAYRLPGFDSPDYAAGVILTDVLNSWRGDLYALVPAGKALFTGFESDALPKAGYGFAAAGFPQGGDGAPLVSAIRSIIAGSVENGIPADLVEAAKLRFRPILMTSLAFGFGVLPLAITTGAGAGAQNAIGTGVLGGMVTATVLVVIFSPLFYVIIEKVFGKRKKGETAKPTGNQPSGDR